MRHVLIHTIGLCILVQCVVSCGKCGYLKRILDSECPQTTTSSSKTTQTTCRTQTTSLAALDSSKAYVMASLSCPTGSITSWKKGQVTQTGDPVLCNHYSDGSGYVMVLVSNNNSGSFKAPNGTVYSHCNDLWAAIGTNKLGASDVSAIFLSANPCLSVKCTDSTGCKATPTTSNYVFVNFNPTSSSGDITDNAPVGLTTGDYLGCAFIDSYKYTNEGYSPIPPIGVSGLNSGLISDSPLAGPNDADSTTDLPTPHSGSLIAGLGAQVYNNGFTTFHIDTSQATLIPGGSTTSAVTISFSTWKDAQQ